MSANIESLFYTDADGRHTPWHGMGNRIVEAPNSDEAIVAAGLDWEVHQTPAYIIVDGEQIATGDMVNYRDIDHKVLGTVSGRYRIVQNREAFAFTDELIGGDVRYETAGALNGGRTVWMLARMPEMNILGDDIESYLLFSNSHDGTSCVRCNITNVRVVCQNTLNFALRTAKRSWSFAHKGNVGDKIAEAQKTLELAQRYNQQFANHAEVLAKKKISAEQAKRILDEMFPVKDDEISKTKLNNLATLRENFNTCYNADDIHDFKGTAWGYLNAFSDMIYHDGATLRRTENMKERKMLSVINGNLLFDKAHELLIAA
jgi:phage/plasmid-like protein (TIGR03299 family)